MTDTPPPPSTLTVNANPAQDSVEALVRQFLLMAAGIATALGYMGWAGKFSALVACSGLIAGFVVTLIGQFKTFRLAKAALPSTPVETKVGWLK